MGQVLIMAESLLVNTDVLVDFFRGYSKAVTFINENSPRIIMPSVVIAELYAGVKGDAELKGYYYSGRERQSFGDIILKKEDNSKEES